MVKQSKQIGYLKGIAYAFLLFILMQIVAYIYTHNNSKKLHYLALLIICIQWIGFLLSFGLLGAVPTEKYYDIIGSFTYVLTLLINYYSLPSPSQRQTLSTYAALIWSTRLGYFLFARIIRNNGIDERFNKIKKTFSDFLLAWTIQGLWIFFTLLSILTISQFDDKEGVSFYNYLGILMWTSGFVIEVTADNQKMIFKNDVSNKDKWISTGLWSISRHPNYFGEIVLWCGMSFICYNNQFNFIYLCFSPVFIALLLIFVSGIPILEKRADLLFSKDKKYIKYKRNTPVLIPYVGRTGNAMF